MLTLKNICPGRSSNGLHRPHVVSESFPQTTRTAVDGSIHPISVCVACGSEFVTIAEATITLPTIQTQATEVIQDASKSTGLDALKEKAAAEKLKEGKVSK